MAFVMLASDGPLWSVLFGPLISLAGIPTAALLAWWQQSRLRDRQQQREDRLRQEQQEREDRLRREQWVRDQKTRLDQLRIEAYAAFDAACSRALTERESAVVGQPDPAFGQAVIEAYFRARVLATPEVQASLLAVYATVIKIFKEKRDKKLYAEYGINQAELHKVVRKELEIV